MAAMNLQAAPSEAYPVAGSAQILADDHIYKSVADSGILAAAIHKSRMKWLTSMLPVFSRSLKSTNSKAVQQIPQDPHTIHALGRCDISIGPHFFYNTKIFEVKWTGPPLPPPALQPGQFPPISQPLTARLNQEASQDHLLGSIMAKVQHRTASQAETTAFTKYIQALYHSLQAQIKLLPRKDAVVIEFRENQMERFILPDEFTFKTTNEDCTEALLTFNQPLPENRHQSLFDSNHGALLKAYLVEWNIARLVPTLLDTFARLALPQLDPISEPQRQHLQPQLVDTEAMAAAKARADAAAAAAVNRRAEAARNSAKMVKERKAAAAAGLPIPVKGPTTKKGNAKRKAPEGSNWGGVRKKGVKQDATEAAAKRKVKPKTKVAQDPDSNDPLNSIKAAPTKRQVAKTQSQMGAGGPQMQSASGLDGSGVKSWEGNARIGAVPLAS